MALAVLDLRPRKQFETRRAVASGLASTREGQRLDSSCWLRRATSYDGLVMAPILEVRQLAVGQRKGVHPMSTKLEAHSS